MHHHDSEMPDRGPTHTAQKEPAPMSEELDAIKGGFKPKLTEEVWVPGAIEVEFENSSQSGLLHWNFSKQERSEFSGAWSEELTAILKNNTLLRWGPSFPFSYPWSKESPEELRKFYAESGRFQFVTYQFPEETELIKLARQLQALPEITRAAPMPRLAPPSASLPGPLAEPFVGTSDQLTNICQPYGCPESQWYVFRCNVDKAWAKASGEGVIVADIDWGFNPNHRDLRNRITVMKNTTDNGSVVSHGNRIKHGTAALGLAGAEVNNFGIAGFAHRASLWAIQAGDEYIEDELFWLSAIDFVRSEIADARKVIILEIQTRSGGNVEMSIPINHAIVDAIRSGVVVCVPAGNAGVDAGFGHNDEPIPATGSILVGATNYDANLNIRFGNTGSRIVVYAPGDQSHDVTCSIPGNVGYTARFGGTSGAVAKVAGVVALMLEMNGGLTQQEICDILKLSRIPVVDYSGNQVGVLVDAEQAVLEAEGRLGRPTESNSAPNNNQMGGQRESPTGNHPHDAARGDSTQTQNHTEHCGAVTINVFVGV